MKSKNVSKIKCSWCGGVTSLKIYSSSKPEEKAKIKEMLQRPADLIHKSVKIQKMLNFQKKKESEKYRKKNAFLESVLRFYISNNSINLNDLPREIVKQDKFHVIKVLKQGKSKAKVLKPTKNQNKKQQSKYQSKRTSLPLIRANNKSPVPDRQKSKSLVNLK